MQKKIITLDAKLLSLVGNDEEDLPSRRTVLRLIGNIKSDSADNARRTARIINILRDPKITELVLESDDMNFLQKRFEENTMGLVAWMQGQILEIIDAADKVELKAV